MIVVRIGEGDFGRIQRLCVHLDGLIGRKTRAKGYRQVRLGRAIKRIRCRIRDLIDELHKQVSRWLVDNYDVILLPTFETSELVMRGKRRLIPDQCGKFLGKTGAEVCKMPECDVVHELLILKKKFLHLHLFLKKRILEGKLGVVVFDDMPERSL